MRLARGTRFGGNDFSADRSAGKSRLASRRRGRYWLRSLAALAILIAGTWLFVMMQGAPTKELAGFLFGVLTGGAVLFALLSGPRSTADCISEEKREGTLGLLFLTDLKGMMWSASSSPGR